MRREEEQSVQQALKLFENREGHDFSGLFLHGDGDFWADMAAYQMLANRPQEAVASLEKAIESGWLETARLVWDPDFQRLNDHPAFQRFRERLNED